MKNYLETLITEKGADLEDDINLEGHYSLTWQMLVDFIEKQPQFHKEIKQTLVMIDFKNGDVFHYLRHLASGMVKSLEYGD